MITIALGPRFPHPNPRPGAYCWSALGTHFVDQHVEAGVRWIERGIVSSLRIAPPLGDPLDGLDAALRRLPSSANIWVVLAGFGSTDAEKAAAYDPVRTASRAAAFVAAARREPNVWQIINEPLNRYSADHVALRDFHERVYAKLAVLGCRAPIILSLQGTSPDPYVPLGALWRVGDIHSYIHYVDPDSAHLSLRSYAVPYINNTVASSTDLHSSRRFRIWAQNRTGKPSNLIITLGAYTIRIPSSDATPYLQRDIDPGMPPYLSYPSCSCAVSHSGPGYWEGVRVAALPDSGDPTPADFFSWLPDSWLDDVLAAYDPAPLCRPWLDGSWAVPFWTQARPVGLYLGEAGYPSFSEDHRGILAICAFVAQAALTAHINFKTVHWHGPATFDDTPMSIGLRMLSDVLRIGRLRSVQIDAGNGATQPGLYALGHGTAVLVVNLRDRVQARIPGARIRSIERLAPRGRLSLAWTLADCDHIAEKVTAAHKLDLEPGLTLVRLEPKR